jgi:hypothetical protein
VRGLFIGLIVLFGAAPAAAQDDVIGGPDLCQDSACGGWLFFGAIAGTAALTVDSILIGEAIDKATHGHGLHAGGATFEIFWGLSHAATGVAIAAHATREDLGLVGLGVPLALVGAYFVVHGAFSLGSPPPPPPEPEEEGSAEEESATSDEEGEAEDDAEESPEEEPADPPAAEPTEPAAAVSFAPTFGGVMVQVFGTF